MPKASSSSALGKARGKRQRTGQTSTTRSGRPQSPGVPDSVRQNIRDAVASLLEPGRESKRKKEDGERSDQGRLAATRIQAAFADRLNLPHVDLESILACEGDADRLQHLAEALHVQTENAIRVFQLLDVDGKGVVVLEDLQRVAPDIMGGEGSGKNSWKDEDLVQMVSQVDRSGDGLLTKDDMIRIARAVGL